jgi:methylenetetrahydrofolate dehydrogenase (NADP+)/methenyltetrahydrofolate cyclohydrolase
LITLLNEDPLIHGILVQSPLPAHLNPLIVFNAISVKKDVDGFSSTNLGLLAQGGRDGFLPCTPLGIAELLKYYQISLKGQHVVVMGRSLIVGKPAALLFLEKSWDATITICHSGTKNIKKITQLADVLIVAIGQPEWVNSDYVHSNAIVVDVGINRLADSTAPKGYRLTGDVAFNDVKNKVKALTPVPGGIGPLTVASLMSNTYKAYLNTDH